MWRYEQSTGKLWRLVAIGYSGHEEAKNQSDLQEIKNRGPIPRGEWHIGPPFHGGHHGPLCMRLDPNQGTLTFGRSGFLIHGDSISEPGTASEGCIILPRAARQAIIDSGDHDLEVVR